MIQSIHFKSNPLYAVEPSNTPNSASNKAWQKQKVFTAVNNVALTIQNGRVNVLNVENGIVWLKSILHLQSHIVRSPKWGAAMQVKLLLLAP
ncbi:hypothetical protein ACIN8IBEIGE_50091 [Acinetobacter sp. 8I-beige]|nr:hypothetical protein ACIN8IBEIGE_50091 [Acinetobacter sp. 8I-beige]